VVDAKIIPDERSNSLIVYATKEDMKMITNIVEKVDRLLAQVLVEAVIMDVQLNNNFEFGVTALMRPQQTGKLTSVASANNGQPLLSAITNLTAGSGLPGGFSYFGKYGGDLDLAVKALASNGKGEILATPRVQTSHATPANFTVGESVPYVTSTYYGGYGGMGYGPSAQLQQLDVQTYLDVTPYITPDGLVVMEIDQNIEEITGYTEIANVGKMPNTTRRSATATVSVQDRDTIILGGYIRAQKSNSKSGVPVLKDIPGLGALFRSTSKEGKRSELLVLIRPTVLPSPKDAAAAVDLAREQMPGLRDMEAEWKEDYRKLNEKSKKRENK
jgi:general secretion pathway protein D